MAPAIDLGQLLEKRVDESEEVLRCIALQRSKLNGGPANLHLAPMLVAWAEDLGRETAEGHAVQRVGAKRLTSKPGRSRQSSGGAETSQPKKSKP